MRINMDETSIALIKKPLRGVLMRVGGRRRGTALPRLPASRSLQRTNFTYAAFVTGDPALNVELPQFILGNTKTFRGENFEELFNASPTAGVSDAQ